MPPSGWRFPGGMALRMLDCGKGSRPAWRGVVLVVAAACLGALATRPAATQTNGFTASVAPVHRLPFAVGERLAFRVRIPSAWMSGQGVMSVDSTVLIRGTATYVLHFDFKARVGPIKASSDETSWLDIRRMAALQFVKRERSPLGNDDQSVELYPQEQQWVAADGRAGKSLSDAPLDELSFIYFVRTLPLAPDTVYTFDRHFESDRNPITVRLVSCETIATPDGPVPTLLVEMRVKDPRHYQGEGVIRINLTDDDQRVPVRIESVIPRIGSTIFTLESRSEPETGSR